MRVCACVNAQRPCACVDVCTRVCVFGTIIFYRAAEGLFFSVVAEIIFHVSPALPSGTRPPRHPHATSPLCPRNDGVPPPPRHHYSSNDAATVRHSCPATAPNSALNLGAIIAAASSPRSRTRSLRAYGARATGLDLMAWKEENERARYRNIFHYSSIGPSSLLFFSILYKHHEYRAPIPRPDLTRKISRINHFVQNVGYTYTYINNKHTHCYRLMPCTYRK